MSPPPEPAPAPTAATSGPARPDLTQSADRAAHHAAAYLKRHAAALYARQLQGDSLDRIEEVPKLVEQLHRTISRYDQKIEPLTGNTYQDYCAASSYLFAHGYMFCLSPTSNPKTGADQLSIQLAPIVRSEKLSPDMYLPKGIPAPEDRSKITLHTTTTFLVRPFRNQGEPSFFNLGQAFTLEASEPVIVVNEAEISELCKQELSLSRVTEDDLPRFREEVRDQIVRNEAGHVLFGRLVGPALARSTVGIRTDYGFVPVKQIGEAFSDFTTLSGPGSPGRFMAATVNTPIAQYALSKRIVRDALAQVLGKASPLSDSEVADAEKRLRSDHEFALEVRSAALKRYSALVSSAIEKMQSSRSPILNPRGSAIPSLDIGPSK